MDSKQLKVGQIVYMAPGINNVRRGVTLQEGTITKVGRKYITITIGGSIWEYRFHKDTLKQETHYTPDYYVWLYKQAYLDSVERTELTHFIQGFFYNGAVLGAEKLPLSKLRKIKEIIEEE